MSKKPKEKLTLAEFMAQLLAEVKAINSNLQSIAKMAEILERINKEDAEFHKQVLEKGFKMRTV
jgi:hypothetical protein